MPHIIIGCLILVCCTWAVFSQHVHDGILGRHLLTFAAISGAGFAYSGHPRAFIISYILLMLFFFCWSIREYQKMVKS